MVEIIAESDYDGYFEEYVRQMVANKGEDKVKHKKIVITAGPWRDYAVSFVDKGDTLHLDFYSALRTGFGKIEVGELMQLIEML